MGLTQCITAKIFLLVSVSVGLNMGVMGLGALFPAPAIATTEIATMTQMNDSFDLYKSPLSPPDTSEPKPRNIQGGA